MIGLRDLTLEKVVFEVRYGKGFLFWDRCGTVWRDIVHKWPDVETVSVTPQDAQLVLKNQELGLKFSHTQAGITQEYPEDLVFFREFTQFAIPLLTGRFEVSIYTRIGNRFMYVAALDDPRQVEELLRVTGFLHAIPEKLKIYSESLEEPEIKFVLKGKETGYIVRIGHLSRDVQTLFHKPMKLDTSGYVRKGISVDIDCFTLRPVDVGLLDCQELIGINERNVRKMIASLLGEG